MQTYSQKRPEECYKYILIRINKYLKSVISLKKRKTINDTQFYNYYFKECAEQNKIELREFFYPFAKGGMKGSRLNAKYFSKLRLSPHFLNDCRDYLENHFYNDHRMEVKKKTISLLQPFDITLLNSPEKELEIVNSISEYIISYSYSKIPWTYWEIHKSVTRFCCIIGLNGVSD